MLKNKKGIFTHIVNIVTIALIIECFLCALLAVRLYAKEDCYDRIEEATLQASVMTKKAIDDSKEKLNIFANVIAANARNTNESLLVNMKNFCDTQYFTSLCIHRADGSLVCHEGGLHEQIKLPSFADERKESYISDMVSLGDTDDKKFFYIMVPIVKGEETVAYLYGFMPLSVLPTFVNSTAYDGKCHFYIVDGNTGDFLMDTWHVGKPLGNIDNMKERETRSGYDIKTMHKNIREGKDGYLIFKSKTTDSWLYTYYMPLGINNWSIQITIDEQTALESYNGVTFTVLILAICVIVFMVMHVLALMTQTAKTRQKTKKGLKKTEYMYKVQTALLNAHNNPDYIGQALRTVANEMRAETMLLLTFSDKMVTNSYYWPSTDKAQAMNMIGRNIKDDCPSMFDELSEGNNVIYYDSESNIELSGEAGAVFKALDVSNIMLVPIVDNAKTLRGAICAVNMAHKFESCEMLECITYDLFMAIANVENHNIIKNMGVMDYLTKLKNRNSYESELSNYATMDCESLWCVFIDANGLHELNNEEGHKAGDTMLCTIADMVKKYFGENHSYRLGGDEFVAFAIDSTVEALMKKKKAIIAELTLKGYSVSLGFEGVSKTSDGIFDVDALVVKAEEIMYTQKREYYERNNIPHERSYFLRNE